MSNEAEARLKINKLLEKSGWRLLEDENGPKNVLVERLDSERKIVEGNKKLIEIYSKKIENRINMIWGD
tara:strand:+ start:92 stop:298 length:207 start_codon:yes stop_codon:yes gene_type:complete